MTEAEQMEADAARYRWLVACCLRLGRMPEHPYFDEPKEKADIDGWVDSMRSAA
jgi:hypothetical protein